MLVCIMLFVGVVNDCEASTFADNFNDGNTDGWSAYSPYPGRVDFGNWRIEDGIVKQDTGGDHYKFLVDNNIMSSQSIEAKVLWHDNGYAGITVWYQDDKNWVDVFYPYGIGFRVMEVIDGNFYYGDYPTIFSERKWQDLKIDANSITGELAIYLDDEYIATHTVVTPNRTGLSGISSGNAGGSFDDFSLTSKPILVGPPTKLNQCTKKGWKTFNNPSFKNQGACVSYVQKAILKKIKKAIKNANK